MARTWAIYKRELAAFYVSPIAYVVTAIFLIICGYFFYSLTAFYHLVSFQAAQNPMLGGSLNPTEGIIRPLVANTGVVSLFVVPLLTMRLFAEEKKQGTIELLFTYPVTDLQALAGKFAAALTVYVAMVAPTGLFPLSLAWLTDIEPGPVAAGYLGLALLGAAFVAIGCLASTLTENQIIAAVVTFGVLLLLWVVGWSADVASGALGRLATHLSLIEHLESFSKGVIETKSVVYYASVTVAGLFLALRVLESKRWRG
ncbi:MAG: ABC transporter permease [Nitrospinota bacterium]